jgi:hypothetical protein
MKAIEFEAMAEQHCIRLPDEIPDGIHLRVLLLMDEQAAAARNGDDLKQLLVGVTEGAFGGGSPAYRRFRPRCSGMGYLIDTNILSELQKGERADPGDPQRS